MTYELVDEKYILWNDTIVIPFITKNGERSFFAKHVGYYDDDVKSYYIYDSINGNVYHHSKKPNSNNLVRANLYGYTPEQVICMIADGDISWNTDTHKQRGIGPKIQATNNWSVQYDNQPIIFLLRDKPQMKYTEVLEVIKNEGGYVDADGFIHKGTATNKIAEIK